MSDASQYTAFQLRDDLADPDVGFDYGTQIALPDGSTFKVGAALEEAGGVIVTADPAKIDSLNAWGAVERVALPDDFEPPADPAEAGLTKAQLLERAAELDIDGRSSMTKTDLAGAIADAEASTDGEQAADPDDGGVTTPDDDTSPEG